MPDGVEVLFCGEQVGTLGDLELAKRYVQEHVSEWIALQADHLERQREKSEADLAAGRARTARAATVAQALRDLGVRVRDSHGLLSLSVEAAEELLAMLQDLREIEERGHV
ncbi:hypothetical protein OV203_25985 [Nannocystis sp. ILAH1]|uniref:hypothetical protein n=1 Tax=Nannocystis sp. ILAH1 TaxID=2996789 RepID=UPI00226D665A|nr:hypothetical protein [Nannocystis sp. ILAH1]MCY0990620.1 hypothetical protein [Nannocystis sp. ILAH1]